MGYTITYQRAHKNITWLSALVEKPIAINGNPDPDPVGAVRSTDSTGIFKDGFGVITLHPDALGVDNNITSPPWPLAMIPQYPGIILPTVQYLAELLTAERRDTTISVSGTTTICHGDSAAISASGGVTYYWSPGGQTTDRVTVNPTVTTTYKVIATDINGCTNSKTVTITVNVCTGIHDFVREEFPVDVFPNPSSGVINFTLKNSNLQKSIKIFNKIGELIYENTITNTLEINTNDWAQGMYFYLISYRNNTISSGKIIIN